MTSAPSAYYAVASPNPQVATAMELAKAALDGVVAVYQVDPNKVKKLVKGSQGFAVLENLVKVGFIDPQIHGQGFLVYCLKNGRWGPPLMLEVYGSSVGPQIGMRVTDVLMVFKTRKKHTGTADGTFLAWCGDPRWFVSTWTLRYRQPANRHRYLQPASGTHAGPVGG